MILMYVHLIHPQHISMILMFDDHDLDERYRSDFDHSFTYKRVSQAYDDPETINLGLVINLEGLSFGLTSSTYERDRLLTCSDYTWKFLYGLMEIC